MVSQKFITHSTGETKILAKNLAKKLTPPSFVCLYGNLGSGKTTFVQGLAEGLGIKRRIISPTFVFIRQYYFIKQQIKNLTFYHIDLYRLETINSVKALGIEEILMNKEAIVAVEWPEKIKQILPDQRIEIYLKYLDKDKREIRIIRNFKLY